MTKPRPVLNPGRICLECVHCYVSRYHEGYSDLTPSEPFEIRCVKKHNLGYGNRGENASKEALRDGLMQAATCRDFELEVKAP